MKRLLTLITALFLTSVAIAQEPFSVQLPNDTLKLGTLKIIKINGEVKKSWTDIIRYFDYDAVKLNYTPKKILPNAEIQTEWLAFDLGIAGYRDYTKYDITRAFFYPALGIPVTKRKMQPKNSSSNVNIWVVQQKLNVYKHKYYFKYGIGFEMFNYYYSNPVNFRNDSRMYISIDGPSDKGPGLTYSKNKLYINYLTVPLILSRTYKFKKTQDINVAGGVNIGYLLNTRNKQISEALGKKKYEGDFNFSDYKMSGVFQIGIGDVKFYGTAALTNTIDKTTSNQSFYPYTFGIRFSKF
jgi:hypothetical protein